MSIQFTSNKNAVMRQFNANKAACLEALGLEAVHNAAVETDVLIYNAPISASGYRRTGALRASLTHMVDRQNDSVIYGPTVHYGIYVTMGTRFMEKLPYMQNSINNYTEDYENLTRQIMSRGMD